RAPIGGVVLTPRMEEFTGTSLGEGDQLLVLGRTDTLEVEFGVAQQDILEVRPGQTVRLRVDALPSRTFEGRVTSIAELPKAQGEQVEYPVRAAVANPDGLLKPDMAAHARVLADPASVVTRTFRGPIRWLRLTWWRIWS
ncbi:MAG TPA: efflux RND transporter periplasmic adaptor subunit, partial [Gemmatimonadales bacterium]|nr:efflux RND transporter periplasmic adaptor subunit [Gemmatimonadales bacterium]